MFVGLAIDKAITPSLTLSFRLLVSQGPQLLLAPPPIPYPQSAIIGFPVIALNSDHFNSFGLK